MKCSIIEKYPEFKARDKKGIWIFKTSETYTYKSTIKDHEFSARWLKIYSDGRIEIPKEYTWDGCTPKFNILDIFIIGTPDGIISRETGKPKTYFASMIHDALYQYYKWQTISRKEIDLLFLQMMRENEFKLAILYYIAVWIFGRFFASKKDSKVYQIIFD